MALCACTAAAVMAADSTVESANIVGYQTFDAVGGSFTQLAITFGGVGTDTINLSDIAFEGVQRGDTIQIFDGDGNVATSIGRLSSGWKSDYAFKPGDSFWLKSKADASIKISGEVKSANIVISAIGGKFTQTGNGTPREVKLSEMTFEGVQRGDTIQIFDGDGNVATSIGRLSSGWKSDYTFKPGESFWLKSKADATITIPSALSTSNQ